MTNCGFSRETLPPMEHTPKNLLIRAVKNENRKEDMQQRREWEDCIQAFHVDPTLKKLLFER